MDFGHDTTRMNVEGDRLSRLPDDLIHKILALNGIKQAIETSALSSRWMYTWTTMPCLSFSSEEFHTYSKFSQFIRHVLSKRNNQIDVHSINADFKDKVSQVILKRIFDYAISHNVQQLNVSFLNRKFLEFPLSIFSSKSLKHLTLSGHFILTPSTWEAAALVTLNLYRVELSDAVFSNCENLKSVTLKSCRMKGLDDFNLCHPGLTSLTLEGGDGCMGVNVVTPQLKYLSIANSSRMHMVSAPNLYSLYYKGGTLSLEISTDLLHLEKVDICVHRAHEDMECTRKIVCLLQQLHSVKFLILNLELVKFLSSMELISHQSSPFFNLKSLTIYPYAVTLTRPEITISSEVKNYLLDGSPGATLTVVSHEEVRTVENIVSTRMLISELQGLLDRRKENSETNKVPMEVENQLDTKIKWCFWERMTDVNEQFTRMYKYIVSNLRETEGLLTKIPTSRRAKLEVSFSKLCADAETLMDDMADHLKILCDKKPRLYFHEPATATSQPSS